VIIDLGQRHGMLMMGHKYVASCSNTANRSSQNITVRAPVSDCSRLHVVNDAGDGNSFTAVR